jgi:protein involved in polysaccharide export with SLBB domain
VRQLQLGIQRIRRPRNRFRQTSPENEKDGSREKKRACRGAATGQGHYVIRADGPQGPENSEFELTEIKFGLMKADTICRLFLIILCIFFWQGEFLAQNPATDDDPQKETETELNLVHLGDLIEVDVVGSLEYDWRGTLTPEGFLNGPEAIEERVYGLCRNEEEIAGEIAKGFGKILRDPKIIVRILDRSNRPVSTVYGAVKNPQRFQIKRPVNLNELIVLAGGLTEKASGEIQIFRPESLSCAKSRAPEKTAAAKPGREPERFISASQNGGSKMISVKIGDLLSGKKEANLQILSGDVVTVLEALPVYVIGGVTTPRQIATRSQITVSRAVASAGGLTKDADATKVTIFRRAGAGSRIIEVDLDKIKANPGEDPALQPFDIVEVPQKGRQPRKVPPVINIEEDRIVGLDKLPLRVVD